MKACTERQRQVLWFAALWCGYLLLCLSFNNYLLVMAGAVFAAALAQRWFDRLDDWRGRVIDPS